MSDPILGGNNNVGRRLVYVLERFPADTLNFVYNEIEVLEAEGFEIEIFSLLPSVFCPEAARSLGNRTTAVKPVGIGQLLKGLIFFGVRRPLVLLGLFLTLPFENRDGFWHKFPRTISHVLFGVYFAYLIRNHRAHVHAHFAHKAATSALCAARLNGTTFSFTAHGSATIHPPSRYSLASKIKHASFIVAVSDFNRLKILKLFPDCPPDRVLVNRTGIKTRDFPFSADGEKASPPFRILCVASLYPIKNHEGLLRACGDLERMGIDYRLDLVGKDEGGRGKLLEDLADGLGIRDRIHFHGVEDHGKVALRLNEADLCVLTSHSEGIPVALMEAMASGVPVLGPRVTGLPELVEEDVNGWLADPRRPEEFAEIMGRVLTNPVELSRVLGPARRTIEERYDMEANARTLAGIFRARIPS